MNIGERIQALRRARGMSQEELANQIGVSRQAVSKWEAGQSQPDMDKVIALSRFFDVSTDYLLTGVQQADVSVATPPQNNPNQAVQAFWIATRIDLIVLAAGLVLGIIFRHSLGFICIMVLCFMCFAWVATTVSMSAKEITESDGKQAAKSFSMRFWRWNIWIIMVPISLLLNFFLDFELFGPTWGAGFILYLVVCIPVTLYCLLDE